jgi:hypothetical protein
LAFWLSIGISLELSNFLAFYHQVYEPILALSLFSFHFITMEKPPLFLSSVNFIIAVTKERKDLFWLTVYKGSVHGCLAHTLGQNIMAAVYEVEDILYLIADRKAQD